MTEAMRTPSRSADSPAACARRPGGVDRAPLRWTPGPDELRLPSDDDEPTPKTTRQSVTIFYCFDCLRSHWRGQRDVFVGADQFIHRVPDYDPKTNPDKPPIAPDVYVAFGVANRHRGSYVPWEEGKAPDFVMEVAAPWSREQDAEEKPGIYAEMGVPEFFLYDPDDCLDPPLSGFELCDGKYKPLPKEQLREGIVGVRSKVLELCLCLVPLGPEPMDVTLRLYDPATDELMPTNLELAERKRQLVEDKRRAEAERRSWRQRRRSWRQRRRSWRQRRRSWRQRQRRWKQRRQRWSPRPRRRKHKQRWRSWKRWSRSCGAIDRDGTCGLAAQGEGQSSSRIRAGSSISSLTVTRKRTASRPSMRRWS